MHGLEIRWQWLLMFHVSAEYFWWSQIQKFSVFHTRNLQYPLITLTSRGMNCSLIGNQSSSPFTHFVC
uniref:Trafficking protein particle complex subunit 2 isoform X2 n=1 Tax=Rhizophora mucronata TaxID=61149 RepID=A0A2P2K7C1_RHIMU